MTALPDAPGTSKPDGTTDPATTVPDQSHAASGPVFLVALVVGWAVMIIGFRSALHEVPHPVDLGRWVLSGLIVHDAFWIPVTVAVGVLSAWIVPVWARAPVRIGLALTAVLVLTTLPVTRRYGASDNTSVDPGNAGVALLFILVALWLAVVVWTLTQRRSLRRTSG